jgi:hypothetical protein
VTLILCRKELPLLLESRVSNVLLWYVQPAPGTLCSGIIKAMDPLSAIPQSTIRALSDPSDFFGGLDPRSWYDGLENKQIYITTNSPHPFNMVSRRQAHDLALKYMGLPCAGNDFLSFPLLQVEPYFSMAVVQPLTFTLPCLLDRAPFHTPSFLATNAI